MKLMPTYDDLLRENHELKRRLAQSERRIAELEAANRELEAKVARLIAIVEDLRRQGKRQAAPFSKKPPKADPKKPGRKPGKGYGTKGHRQPPSPSEIDETYDAPLPEKSPCCG